MQECHWARAASVSARDRPRRDLRGTGALWCAPEKRECRDRRTAAVRARVGYGTAAVRADDLASLDAPGAHLQWVSVSTTRKLTRSFQWAFTRRDRCRLPGPGSPTASPAERSQSNLLTAKSMLAIKPPTTSSSFVSSLRRPLGAGSLSLRMRRRPCRAHSPLTRQTTAPAARSSVWAAGAALPPGHGSWPYGRARRHADAGE
jgi:hypothetical protein